MQFLTLATALFSATVLAAPAVIGGKTENINISEYTVRKTDGIIKSVSFKLSGNEATGLACSRVGDIPDLSKPSGITTCGDSKYRFAVTKSPDADDTMPGLAIYHETGPAVGRWAESVAPGTYCRLAGGGPADYVCNQTTDVTTIVISY